MLVTIGDQRGKSNVLHLDGQVPRSSCKEFYDNDEWVISLPVVVIHNS